MNAKTQEKRGGRRAGAGRPPLTPGEKAVGVCFSFRADVAAVVKANKGEMYAIVEERAAEIKARTKSPLK